MHQLEIPETAAWGQIDSDQTEITAVWRRSAFLHRLKRSRDAIAHLMIYLNERKRTLIERAPEGADLTAHVAERFRYGAHERSRLTQFLRHAYPGSGEDRWERVHDAELFNTARTVYRKAGGYQAIPLDELLHRAADDRQGRKRLASVIPLDTGFGLRDRVAYARSGPCNATAAAYREPGVLTAYTTRQQYWVAFTPLPEPLAQQLGSAEDLQVTRARRIVEGFQERLKDRYPFLGLELRTRMPDPEKRFSI